MAKTQAGDTGGTQQLANSAERKARPEEGEGVIWPRVTPMTKQKGSTTGQWRTERGPKKEPDKGETAKGHDENTAETPQDEPIAPKDSARRRRDCRLRKATPRTMLRLIKIKTRRRGREREVKTCRNPSRSHAAKGGGQPQQRARK